VEQKAFRDRTEDPGGALIIAALKCRNAIGSRLRRLGGRWRDKRGDCDDGRRTEARPPIHGPDSSSKSHADIVMVPTHRPRSVVRTSANGSHENVIIEADLP